MSVAASAIVVEALKSSPDDRLRLSMKIGSTDLTGMNEFQKEGRFHLELSCVDMTAMVL
jgi:hypothetical protein